ncbi:hypothetical protein GGTG_07632 [Gaeumannomyces tritici R3-111a-1]|uniref:Uncharacterized protein n=1 Tax=Gaeumannomyces tritici (strain R3-111a-1) TaxID=644352 RepID=J3P284_GAET3|nr:hypothetical protein GGTG_07632 [Gaeumannomyces tritici R3-111a-1]EJT73776.1 hypothetical protein GGTG_07632 [Gaeumannomyces tritici R3-111a-1]
MAKGWLGFWRSKGRVFPTGWLAQESKVHAGLPRLINFPFWRLAAGDPLARRRRVGATSAVRNPPIRAVGGAKCQAPFWVPHLLCNPAVLTLDLKPIVNERQVLPHPRLPRSKFFSQSAKQLPSLPAAWTGPLRVLPSQPALARDGLAPSSRGRGNLNSALASMHEPGAAALEGWAAVGYRILSPLGQHPMPYLPE